MSKKIGPPHILENSDNAFFGTVYLLYTIKKKASNSTQFFCVLVQQFGLSRVVFQLISTFKSFNYTASLVRALARLAGINFPTGINLGQWKAHSLNNCTGHFDFGLIPVINHSSVCTKQTLEYNKYQEIASMVFLKTSLKAQHTRGLSSAYQSNLFRSYHKFKHKS